MAIPTWVDAGTASGGTGTATPGLPTGWAENDIFLMFVACLNGPGAAPSGWTQVGSTQYANSGINTSRVALAVYWRRATASESAPTVADAGDHTLAVIHAFRGVKTSGDPWNAQAGAWSITTNTSISCPTVTTTVDDCLVVLVGAISTDTAAASFSAWSNASLSSLTERSDEGTTAGTGSVIGVATGGKATAGATGATTATVPSSNEATMTIALEPAPPAPPGVSSVGILIC